MELELTEESSARDFLDNFRRVNGRRPNIADAFIAGRQSMRDWYGGVDKKLALTQAERDSLRAELSNARILLGDPVGVDIAIMGLLTERYNLHVDNAKMRFYIVELEAASRTIDMHLAQQAARKKYEAAFGDQAAEGRPIGVDRPGQPLCQLPEGHEGLHGHCEACNGTGELDNSPEYMRCPICHGSGRRQP